ncbi:MAG: bifunctional tRNA (5-methylaminomethyl-2-thiouridine)(34)-methyltransferase MnmD/FAD-dependent 5-carboxymethylaminomethyl-2-thiouridine(34) oxidoreductase MnmC [Betaproteobacteria bacterium]
MRLQPATLSFADGTPYSAAFEDVYHSAAGGPAQARHVFLQGNGLPARWAGRERFIVLETGFGLGLNFLVTWHEWRRDAQRCARLHFVSVERHPFTLRDLQRLHALYPQLGREAAELHAQWPVLVPGAHRLELDEGRVVLTLHFADVSVLRELCFSANAVYLDGFSPAKNPDMWTPQALRNVSRLAARGTTLATWSVASSVRHALEATGFAVEKRPGFGDKREMLAAVHVKGNDSSTAKQKHAAVIGAGLAGAAVCERLCSRGWEVDLHERNAGPAAEASGNHAGTFHPIATPDDSVFARITRAASLYSVSRWRRLDRVRWDACGVLQLARDEKEAASQARAAALFPAEYVEHVTREEAARHAGVPVAAGGLWFPRGGWVQPRTLVQAQLEACGSRIRKNYNSELEFLPAAPVVVLANSSGAPKLCRVPHLRLRRVRGQLTYVPEDLIEPPHVVVLRGGMVLPPVDGLCVVGASYDIDDADATTRADSHAGNVKRLQTILGQEVSLQKADGRVAFRAVAPDRLPVAGRIDEGVYRAFAFGSRGIIWAALAAELIASQLEGEPLPLEGSLVKALDPLRFRRRAESRGSRP